jgi:hypothetical protein
MILTAALAVAAVNAEADEILPLAAVERGQRGFGLTVFEGSEVERFQVEVIGVWENLQPGTSFILGRLSGRGLEETGVIAGMSGSPVFIDGRLAGAVAFAWPFSQEAIAGITPIESMRRLMDIETGSEARADALRMNVTTLLPGGGSREALELSLGRLRPESITGGSSALEWTAAGFGTTSRDLIERAIGGLAPAGRSETSPSGPLVPGSAVSALLIDGDLRLASTGTVTDRTGDTILAFGHPFLGLGEVTVPMATAEVVAVISNLSNSFKITNVGPVVGALEFDHAVGIRGRVGGEAPMIPIRVRLRGDGERLFQMRIADVELLTPTLLAVATLGTLDAATDAVGSKGLDLLADLDLGAAGRLQIDQSFEGPSAAMDAAVHLFTLASYLMQNDLEGVKFESVDVEIVRHVEPRTVRLVGAHAARSVVRPGETVTLNLDLVEFRGGRVRKAVPVRMPTNLPAGRYSLLVGDGVSVDAARLSIEQAEPVSFAQALELLDSLSSRRDLVVIGVFGDAGLAVAGEVLPRLPGSMRSLWGPAPSGSARPLGLALAQQQRLRLEVPVEGILRVDVEVERKQPLSPSGPDGAGEGEEPAAAGGEV